VRDRGDGRRKVLHRLIPADRRTVPPPGTSYQDRRGRR
jgi:hypothetical protein